MMDTKALRQKILDLAIHGKLVPQDPNDEPASVLLERIKAEKERLIKEGKIKRSKKSAKSSDTPHYENVPFELPNSWVWCRLEDIAYVASGSTPDKTCFVENGVPYIKMYNLRNQKIDFAYHPQYITEEVHNGKLQRSRTEVGDLIMNIVGPPLGKLAIIPTTLPQANFNQAAVLIRPYKFKEVLVSYLKVYLEEMSEINSIATRGSAGQVNISLTQSQNMRIPIPPLNEVRRIIEEVSKYDILIDSLKQNITDIQNLIAYTKSKILDLAIHGKLVPQDPNDEPAIELLKRINPDFTPCDNGHYTQLPEGWAICKMKQITSITNGKSQKNVETLNGIYPIYGSGGVIGRANQYLCIAGSTIIGRKGTINNPIFVEEHFWNVDTAFGLKANDAILDKYLYYFCLSFDFSKLDKSTAMPSLTKTSIGNVLIPIPPYKEQERIVAKIDMVLDTMNEILRAV
ncbi:Type-1 restriction enzyme EcoKI specificity protein [Phocaeicola vulgatus]|jgi:type I restriction enzyme, S subunit|uniref:Type-1 restriction enzyme EcoKI specificity protein n=4 Tax=Phocaeicola vulgatus TaxID=821 RepID=A0A5P3ARP7_PHOVU|nr:restriction endonuclease subunit S [Phocaeicola vulgatus]MCG0295407.1 restriction endonuclease subunit S [Phocaeicola vulgatus]MCG0363990.1 restriction endonuclease subunit S [Phocaeicola vulgatus]MCS3012367.1 restriction endonuclease subunit S [Phocaeicola vulgatus]MDB0810202.1 restriction endonuclease subunit S [Phocaeicola vulgatus]MDB1025881.1 restriction endonuclease subunit S [Phocaeicola vulgatus]